MRSYYKYIDRFALDYNFISSTLTPLRLADWIDFSLERVHSGAVAFLNFNLEEGVDPRQNPLDQHERAGNTVTRPHAPIVLSLHALLSIQKAQLAVSRHP